MHASTMPNHTTRGGTLLSKIAERETESIMALVDEMDELAPRSNNPPINTTRATQSTAHRASTPACKSQGAQDTVHARQPTERAHR